MAELTVAGVLSAISAASAVVSLAMTLSMRPEDGAKDNGLTVDRKGSDNPKIVPFGHCRVPAIRVWNNVNNTNTAYLAQVYSLGVGQLRGVEQVYIDGVPYLNTPNSMDVWHTFNTSNEFPNAALGIRVGKPTEEAYSQLFEHSDGEWAADCRGDRTASISMLVQRQINEDGDNNIRIVSDRLDVEALVHGNAVIDPRIDPTLEGVMFSDRRTWSSYRNPACVVLTYLVDTYYGMGIPASAVDVKSFVDVANYCEREGIYFDGYIDQNASYGDILKNLVTSFDGIVYVEDGVVKAKADRLSQPITHITEDDCVGAFKLSNASDSAYYNIVNVEYTNTATTYCKDKYVLPTDVTLVHQKDGFEKVKELKLPYTAEHNGSAFVKHVANKALKAVKHQRTIEFELDNTRKKLGIWDVFTISNTAYKLDKAMFRVDKVVTSLDDKTMVTKVTATQYSTTTYDDSDYSDGDHSNPVLPPTNQILEPVNLEFVQTTFGTTGSGTLSWTPRYMKEHKTCIEYKLASAATWTRIGEFAVTSHNLVNLERDTYDFRVRTVSYSGSTSPWAILEDVRITSDIVMPIVTGLTGTFDTQDCILQWDDMTKLSMGGNKTYAEVFSHYEVILYSGDTEVYRSTYSASTNNFVYTYTQHVADGVPNRKLHVEVKMVSKDGVKSRTATRVMLKNSQCAQPSGVNVSGILTTVYARWDQPEEVDYLGSEIHVSTDPIFEPSVNTLLGVSTGEAFPIEMDAMGKYYLRIGHFDVFGTDEMAYSDPIFFTQVNIEDLLEETPLWGDLETNLGNIQGEVDQAKKDIVANATSITGVNNTLGSHGALISANATAIQSTQGNLAEFEQEVAADFQGVNTSISQNQTAIAEAQRSIASVESALSSELDGVKANLGQNYYTKTQTDGQVTSAVAAAKTELNSKIAGTQSDLDKVEANLAVNYYTKTQTDGKVSTAIAASESKLNAEIAGNKAAISNLNQVTATTDGKVEALTQIKHDVNGKVSGLIMGNDGETSHFTVVADKFMVTDRAGDKAVFQVVTYPTDCPLGCVDGRCTGHTVIRNAVIGKLDAQNINGGAITGNHISSNTIVRAGQGRYSAILDGQDALWRLYAGDSVAASAPFRVDKNGKLYATEADITGHINATSGSFTGHVRATSIELPAGTLPDVYQGQNSVQIWGGGYNSDKTRGWGINSNGYAEFLGGLNTKNATIEGATIIGSTIYSGESLYSIDFEVDGVTDDLRYINNDAIPLGARPSYNATTSTNLTGGRDWMSTQGTFNVLSCTERRGNPNSSRFRWGKIRANAMKVSSTAGYINQLRSIWDGTVGAKFTITLYAPDGSVVERSPVTTISRALGKFYEGTDTSVITVAGVSFDASFRYKTGIERDHNDKPVGYWAELGGFSVSNRAGSFGSKTDNAKNGYFGIEVSCGLISGSSNGWTGNNRGVNYTLVVNNSDLPA